MVALTFLSTSTHMFWQPGGLRAGKSSPLTGAPGSDVVVELRRGNLDYYLILKRAAWSYPQASSVPAYVSMYLYSPFSLLLAFSLRCLYPAHVHNQTCTCLRSKYVSGRYACIHVHGCRKGLCSRRHCWHFLPSAVTPRQKDQKKVTFAAFIRA